MFRSFIPFLLASLGFTFVALAINMPLFEWQISEVVTDFPSTYEVHIQPSPWTTKLGDSLDHGYVSFGEIHVLKDRRECNHESVNFIVKRSQTDEKLERMSVNTEKATRQMIVPNVIGIFLSVIYMWWFTIWYKRPIEEVIVFVIVAGAFCFGLTQVARNLLPMVGQLGTLDCYPHTVTFNAGLSKAHYEALLVFFTGTLLELGAFGIIVRQIISAVVERKKPSKSAVG